MATVKAEYQDESGRDDSTSALVSALESMQTLLNTELTNLLEAEKASDSSTQQSEQRKRPKV
ncbi:hypothetical protein LPJ55_001913 [Coemansia sp. RSA 990]|nr:hypothetical protein LPJ55_001913 [Coemansia sp. RSA 990]